MTVSFYSLAFTLFNNAINNPIASFELAWRASGQDDNGEINRLAFRQAGARSLDLSASA